VTKRARQLDLFATCEPGAGVRPTYEGARTTPKPTGSQHVFAKLCDQVLELITREAEQGAARVITVIRALRAMQRAPLEAVHWSLFFLEQRGLVRLVAGAAPLLEEENALELAPVHAQRGRMLAVEGVLEHDQGDETATAAPAPVAKPAKRAARRALARGAHTPRRKGATLA